MNTIEKAEKVFLDNFEPVTWFERAIFLSWYCGKGDCKFCYMSIQKQRIKNPKLAKRRIESILAEVILTKACGWNIEFLSGGYDSYSREEMQRLLKRITEIHTNKVWLNIGVLNESEIQSYMPFIKGVVGAVETINPRLHQELCPSKPIEDIDFMFHICKRLGLDRAITIIIGLGETIKDFALLKDYINKHDINRITFYALNPHKGTFFNKGPEPAYYAEWIARTRISFPELEIIAGSWVDRLEEISLLLKAGANAFTKFPAIKLFGSKYAQKIEKQCILAGRTLKGSMTRLPKKPCVKDNKINKKLEMYLHKMQNNKYSVAQHLKI